MRKESTINQGLDENLICRSLEFFALQKIGMTGFKGLIGRSLDACLRKRGMTNKKGCQLGGMTLLFCLLSGVAHAECVPAPDCASIGYTETSCETASLKCPFDTSKLKCLPCDSTFRYSCSGDNVYRGIGAACNGKYAECACLTGTIFVNGQCVCDTSCKVGAIYYSDGTCASVRCYDSLKTAIGVVVKDNELVLSQRSSSQMMWSNADVDTSLTNYENETNVKEDFNGKSNTVTIMTEDTRNIVAKYCNDYTTAGTSAGDWYLPAAGELYSYVYGNYSAIGVAMSSSGWTWGNHYLWSSSEGDTFNAWNIGPSDGRIGTTGKYNSSYISCLLAIN